MAKRRAFARFVVVLGAATACSRARPDESVVGTTSLTSATATTIDGVLANEAIERLIEARCHQEQLCGEMGSTSSSSATPIGCADDVRAAIGDRLLVDCPRGVGRAPLDACAAALRTETCGASVGEKALPEPCRAGSLCATGPVAP